jgi:tripartite ATP-independent transporter DctP family solute receptor
MATETRIARPSWLWLLAPLLLIAFGLYRYISTPSAQASVLRLAHALNEKHPVHLGMLEFKAELERLSGGSMRVELYSDSKLGNERELLELLQTGSLAMTKVSAGQLEAFAPSFKLFSLPYLFADSAHFWRFAESPTAKSMLQAAERYRLRGLSFYDAGARSFYLGKKLSKAIAHPDDLRGLSLRVMPSQSAIAMVEAFGAKPVPIPFGELYSALDTGAVDGAENNAPSLFTSRQYEVASRYMLNEHTMLPDVLIIGTPTWNRLSTSQREWVQQAADYSTEQQKRFWRDSELESLRVMREKGLQIDAEVDRAAFRAKVDAIYQRPEFQSEELRALIAAVEQVRE